MLIYCSVMNKIGSAFSHFHFINSGFKKNGFSLHPKFKLSGKPYRTFTCTLVYSIFNPDRIFFSIYGRIVLYGIIFLPYARYTSLKSRAFVFEWLEAWNTQVLRQAVVTKRGDVITVNSATSLCYIKTFTNLRSGKYDNRYLLDSKNHHFAF